MKDKLPKGWEWKRLGDVAIVSSGNSALQDSNYYFNGTFDFVRTSDVGRIRFGKIFSTRDKLNKAGFEKMQLFKKGTILFPKSGASVLLNHRVILEKDACVSSHLATIKSINNICEDYYLLYFLATISAKDLIAEMSYPSLRTSVIQKILVPLPSLFEQKQIVSVLENTFTKINQAIALLEENVQKLKQLNESILDEVFGNADKFISFLDYVSISRKTITPEHEETYNIVGLENIESNTGELVNFKPIKGSQSISNKVIFKKGDILYGKLRPYLNKVYLAEFDGIATTEIIPFKVNEDNFFSRYVLYFLRSPHFLNQVNLSCSGARMPRVTTEFWKTLLLPFLSVSEQQRIVDYLDQTTTKNNQLIQYYQNKLETLKRLKNSILDSAFKGALRREKVVKPQYDNYFKIQVLYATIWANQTVNVKQGEMATAKDVYLLDKIYGVKTRFQFSQQNWGAFDPKEKQLLNTRQYFHKPNFPNSKAFYLDLKDEGKLLEKISEELKTLIKNGISELHHKIFKSYFGTKKAEMKELLATILKCIEDIQDTDFDKIRETMVNWKTPKQIFKNKAEKFSPEITKEYLNLIINENWHLKVLN